MHAYVVQGTTVLHTVATYNYTVIAARHACIAGVPAGVPISSVEDNCTNPQMSQTLSVSGDTVTHTILLKSFRHSLFLLFHSVEQAKLNSALYISESLFFMLNKHSLLNNVSESLRFLRSANLHPVGVLWLSCVDAIAVQKLSITIVHKPPKYDYYTNYVAM